MKTPKKSVPREDTRQQERAMRRELFKALRRERKRYAMINSLPGGAAAVR